MNARQPGQHLGRGMTEQVALPSAHQRDHRIVGRDEPISR
jgi:hypothetical protein